MTHTAIRCVDIAKCYRRRKVSEDAGSIRALATDLLSGRLFKSRDVDEEFWALRDVSFDIEPGEVVGIIGRNGAGKSTLLKIFSNVTAPTRGRVEIRGRVGSLLEVGTGFHPELSGRENVFMNGAILGMERAEVQRRFDEIVDFAGVEEFIDAPVKTYSSGMKMRLAFSVAAQLDSEILIVDEVLAVGDAEFRQKCMSRLDGAANDGRTVLFVSHSMAVVERLCDRCIQLENGKVIADGPAGDVVNDYLREAHGFAANGACYQIDQDKLDEDGQADGFRITSLALNDLQGEPLRQVCSGEGFVMRLAYEADEEFPSPAFVLHLNSRAGQRLLQLNTTPVSGYQIERLGKAGVVELRIESLPLTSGSYYLDVGFSYEARSWIVKLENIISLFVDRKDVYGSGMALDQSRGLVIAPHSWRQMIEPC